MNEIYGNLIRNYLCYWLIKRFVIVLKYKYIFWIMIGYIWYIWVLDILIKNKSIVFLYLWFFYLFINLKNRKLVFYKEKKN